MKGRYEIIKAIFQKSWESIASLQDDRNMEFFIDASPLDAEPFRLVLEEAVKQGSMVDVSSVRMKVDTGTSRLKCRLGAALTHREAETVVSFLPFREVAFQKSGGLISMGIRSKEKPLLVLAFPDMTDEINVKYMDNIRDQSLIFNRQINRLFQENESFRNVFCDLLTALGEDKQILRDIAKTIREDHCFMIPYAMDELLCFRDAEALTEHFNWAGIGLAGDLSMNQAYYLARIALPVQDADWDVLAHYCKTNKNYYCEDDLLQGGPDPARFLTAYVLSKNPEKDYSKVFPLIEKYIETCNDEDELASLTEIEEL